MTSRRISLRPLSGRRSRDEPAAPVPEAPRSTAAGRVDLGKGRPTPKRSEAQKRRGGPVAPPPATRREAAQRLRTQQSKDRKQTRDGTVAGDQKRMLPRDAGPVRALVRDLVDGKRNAGVLMLPVALTFVVAQLVGNSAVLAVAARLFTLGLLLVLADLVVTSILIRRNVRAQFPEERSLRGHLGYGLLRSTVLRPLRMPPTHVKPGPLLRR